VVGFPRGAIAVFVGARIAAGFAFFGLALETGGADCTRETFGALGLGEGDRFFFAGLPAGRSDDLASVSRFVPFFGPAVFFDFCLGIRDFRLSISINPLSLGAFLGFPTVGRGSDFGPGSDFAFFGCGVFFFFFGFEVASAGFGFGVGFAALGLGFGLAAAGLDDLGLGVGFGFAAAVLGVGFGFDLGLGVGFGFDLGLGVDLGLAAGLGLGLPAGLGVGLGFTAGLDFGIVSLGESSFAWGLASETGASFELLRFSPPEIVESTWPSASSWEPDSCWEKPMKPDSRAFGNLVVVVVVFFFPAVDFFGGPADFRGADSKAL